MNVNQEKRLEKLERDIAEAEKERERLLREIAALRGERGPVNELVLLVRGMMEFYGAMTYRELGRQLARFTDKPLTREELAALVDEVEADDEASISRLPEGICAWGPEDYEAIKREHARRPQLDFKPFTREELLEEAQGRSEDREGGPYRELVELLISRLGAKEVDAENFAFDSESAFRYGETPMDVWNRLDEIGGRIEFRDLKISEMVMEAMVKLYHDTGQWALKGYSPDEASAMLGGGGPSAAPLAVLGSAAPAVPAAATSRTGAAASAPAAAAKAGRNDPCPCGSGKKFKKCCGASSA